MKIFSERLKKIRAAKIHEQENLDEKVKCTQSFMAELLGITQQAYCRYEDNTAEPNLETLKLLAEYFEVSADYLIGITDDTLLK